MAIEAATMTPTGFMLEPAEGAMNGLDRSAGRARSLLIAPTGFLIVTITRSDERLDE